MVNAIATAIIVPAIIFLYPPELWQYELMLSLSLTYLIATPATYFMANQIQKNNELTDELQRLVDRDRLTDVSTRDYFFNRMAQAPESFGISLMVDIDLFKGINDNYGHLAGDQVIREVAKLLKENIREGDIVARFGGEEFIVFLDSKNMDSGFKIAERMRKAIADKTFEFNDTELKVTVSIGGSLKDTLCDLEKSIQEADDALYEAKRSGRNRTVFADKVGNLKEKFSALESLNMVSA